jgi:hypothetical protein
MRAVLFGLIGVAMISSTGFASDTIPSLDADQALAAVKTQANRFISRTAPDFGGKVHSPCETNLDGDDYTVTCKGVANDTMPGDGMYPFAFTCVGDFTQGEDGLYYQASPTKCRSDN